MFTHYFDYRKINTQHFTVPFDIISHNYTFYGRSKKRYVVVAEQYDHQIFAVKFYLAEDKNCKHKFKKLTKLFECNRVLSTVGRIIKELIDENPYASFVFIGSGSKGEANSNTKRYQLYLKIIENLISSISFEHHYSDSLSSYVMINRHNSKKEILSEIETRIKEVFEVEGYF